MEKKDSLKTTIDFFKNSKVQWALLIIALFAILYTSSSIRVSNVPLLIDQTTGENIPLALDPFYFLRVAQTYVADNGVMPDFDPLRYNPERQTAWHHEIHPYMVVHMFNFVSSFNSDMSLEYFYVLSPVIFFFFGLIFFFLFSSYVSKNKWVGLLSASILAFIPAYLYRTMAGFADHESVGMMTYFLVLLVYLISVNNVARKKDAVYKSIIFGALLGLFTAFNIATWTGVSTTLFLILPISLFLIWVFNTKKNNPHFINSFILFYISWILFTILSGPLFSFSFSQILNSFINSDGIITLIVLIFILVDTILIYQNFDFIKKKFRILYTFILSAIVGSIGLMFLGRSPLSLITRIISRLIIPFGKDRFGTTVAENQAPFLAQWISQTGNIIFWLFVFGIFLFGYQITKKVKNIMHRLILLSLFILMAVGIIFSKYAQNSVLNGESMISILFYFIPLVSFWIYFFYCYFNNDFKWSKNETLIFALIFFTIVSGRAAARMFFLITPFVCFLAAYFVINTYKEYSISKDKVLRLTFILLFILSLIFSLIAINQSYKAIATSAEFTSPSANPQWQGAMSWVRDNTPEDSVFVHWWDYGYWVESLGKRKTVADGGHFQGSTDGNHKIGRYVLTTPNPDTANSYFKSMDIDYLLIDPTELGKYSAYSRIGSDTKWDRFAFIPTGSYDPKEIQETNNETVYLYRLSGAVDEDTKYNDNGTNIFLPGPTYTSTGDPSYKSYVGGVFIKRTETGILQPEVVYIYNNNQLRIPIRYVYFNEELHDFKTGLDAVVYLVPSLTQDTTGRIQIDPMGGLIYLSPKVSKSLFAQVYLLDDAFGNYPDLKLVHSEDSYTISQLARQNVSIGEFVFFQGLQGPIKIYETSYPEDTKEVPAFYEIFNGATEGFGSLDKYFE